MEQEKEKTKNRKDEADRQDDGNASAMASLTHSEVWFS